jgi:hypothetical protein
MSDRAKMYGDRPENLQATLSRMVQESWQEANCNRNLTYALTRDKLEQDRRFDHYQKDNLIEKAKEAGSNGTRIDWNDPYLVGGPKRPLSR